MDTRSKILAWAGARALVEQARPPLVTGHFDPLTAGHARRLAALAETHGPLFVLITEPPDPVLPAAARAHLVAALACVQCVMLAPPEGPEAVLAAFPPERVLRGEEADLELREALQSHVRARHAQSAAIPGEAAPGGAEPDKEDS